MAFDTRLRDEAVLRENALREHLRLVTIASARDALAALASEFNIREAYLFGSVSRMGAFREASDVDIAVVGERVDSLGLAARLSRMVGREAHVFELDEGLVSERAKREGIRWTPVN